MYLGSQSTKGIAANLRGFTVWWHNDRGDFTSFSISFLGGMVFRSVQAHADRPSYWWGRGYSILKPTQVIRVGRERDNA